MQPISFTAHTAEAAVAQIRAQLGPEAIVLNVRPLPQNGIARLWQKPMIEVVACAPEQPTTVPATPAITEVLAEFRQQLVEIRQQVETRSARPEVVSAPGIELAEFSDANIPSPSSHGKWGIAALLQKGGLLPVNVQKVIDLLVAEHGEQPPATLVEEIEMAQAVLTSAWQKSPNLEDRSVHALVGSAGSGKTTSLCKWLTQSALMEARRVRLWRLDGATANTAESLSVYAEILGVNCERFWNEGQQIISEDIGFMDLPGVDWRNALAIKELAGQLKQLGSPKLHLVLNGAYDVTILLAQVRAFSVLPIEDIVLTHLDEETRWGKFWNLALGTTFPIRYLSTGQNIPGDFQEATAPFLLSRQFLRK